MSSERLIANELLAFLQHAIDTMDEVSIMQICKTNFKEEEICRSKVLLFDTLGLADRMPVRRRDDKGERSLQDIINLLKTTDPDDVPAFVAKDLHKLPPVTFDHVDVTSLLKDITTLKAGLAEISRLNEKMSSLSILSNRQSNGVSPPPARVALPRFHPFSLHRGDVTAAVDSMQLSLIDASQLLDSQSLLNAPD